MATQCCCGKYKPLDERFVMNETMHEPLGEPGAFCGSLQAHELHDLREKLAEREAERDRIRDAAVELIEVAELRGDNVLPLPEDDPLLWTTRMQTAWNELEEALTPEPEKNPDG